MPTFADFSITFGTPQGDVFPVTVLSTAGRPEGTFRLPVDLVDALGRAVGPRSREIGRADDAEHAPGTVAGAVEEQVGRALFEALVHGPVETCFRDALTLGFAKKRVVRVRLHMDLANPAVAPLAVLPWELLYFHERRLALAKRPETAVVRHLNIPGHEEWDPFSLPLRILFVMANPANDLDLAAERREVEQRLRAEGGRIQWEFLENATWSKFETCLHEKDFHVVHFMGHGQFDGREGSLLFEGEGAGMHAVRGSRIAELLAAEPNTRLVVLNACRTANVAEGTDDDAYAGVATALMMAGVPAVIAMQAPITDDAARRFAARLYSSLAAGQLLEVAVGNARRAIQDEWAIPVIFSRHEGDLFGVESAATAPRASAIVPAVASHDLDRLPYMVDRGAIVAELHATARQLTARPDQVLVAVLHGDDDQCQDKFVERLRKDELPRSLEIGQDAALTEVHLTWPEQVRTRERFHADLTSALARKLTCPESPAAIQRHFSSLPGPVMIKSQVYATQWAQYPDTVLDDYMAYWQGWPGKEAIQRVVVLLFLVLKVPPTGWFKGRAMRKANEALQAVLHRYDPAGYPGLHTTPLLEMKGIEEHHVLDWNSEYGIPVPPEAIKRMFQDHLASTGLTTMSMEKLGDRIEKLLDARQRGAA